MRLHRIFLRLRSLFRRNRVEQELANEFAFHLDRQTEENLARGLSASEARAAALRELGGIAQLQEECRDMRRVNLVETVLADVRYAARGFRRQPGFAILATLTLALGIGASTALFSLVNTVLIRRLPFADPGRLAMIWESDTTGRTPLDTPAPANFADWKARNRTFDDMAAGGWVTFNFTGWGEPEQIHGQRVTANFFSVLGVKPAVGRLLAPSDDNLQSGHVAVIGYGFWQRRFREDPGVAGRTVTLNGEPYLIVGVAPAGFEFPSSGAEIWVAPGFTQRDFRQRNNHFLFTFGRLKKGVSLKQARADMTAIARRLEMEFPQSNTNIGAAVVPLREYYAGDLKLALTLLLAAVGVLVLIVCMNLAHLFLARGATRRREIGMRAALGAGRARVIRQLLTECVALSIVAAALGAALSTGAFGFLARLIPDNFATGTKLHFDATVFGFTAAIAFLTAVLFGMAPAIQASRIDLNEVLKLGSGRGSARRFGAQGAMVVTEVGLTVLLLIGAGLLLESYIRIRNVNIGFRAENLLVLETPLPPAKYSDLSLRGHFYREVVEKTTKLPGVISAAYVNFPPLTFAGGSSCFYIEGKPRPRLGESPCAFNRVATADYFRTIGVPLVRGRMFEEQDNAQSPRVLMINQVLARKFWPGEDALGQGVRFGDGGPNQPVYTVIGIAGDVRQVALNATPSPEMYFPATQAGPGGSFFWPHALVVRTAGNPSAPVGNIRKAIAAVDPDLPVANVRTMIDVLNAQTSGRQTQTVIVSAFAAAALLLASIGLYGVLSYAVAQRKVEIGIRMALGARRGEVIRGITGQALRWTAFGVMFGLAGAFALTRMFSALLFNVSPWDPFAFAAATLLSFAVAALASFVPARRAAGVDPVVALRQD
jgi:predicted permease